MAELKLPEITPKGLKEDIKMAKEQMKETLPPEVYDAITSGAWDEHFKRIREDYPRNRLRWEDVL